MRVVGRYLLQQEQSAHAQAGVCGVELVVGHKVHQALLQGQRQHPPGAHPLGHLVDERGGCGWGVVVMVVVGVGGQMSCVGVWYVDGLQHSSPSPNASPSLLPQPIHHHNTTHRAPASVHRVPCCAHPPPPLLPPLPLPPLPRPAQPLSTALPPPDLPHPHPPHHHPLTSPLICT